MGPLVIALKLLQTRPPLFLDDATDTKSELQYPMVDGPENTTTGITGFGALKIVNTTGLEKLNLEHD